MRFCVISLVGNWLSADENHQEANSSSETEPDSGLKRLPIAALKEIYHENCSSG